MASDFAVNLHACLLIAMPIATLIAVLVLRRRIPERRSLLLATVLAGAVTFVAGATKHLCYAGDPYYQWIIGGPCLLLALAFVHGKYWRRCLGAVLAVLTLGLTCHFIEVVHEPEWKGNPDYDGYAGLVLQAMREVVPAQAKEHEQVGNDYPPGWLRDLPIWPEITANTGDHPPSRIVLHSVWHTWLTGLYRADRIPQDYWYPGGRLDEAGAYIEFRDKPEEL